MLFGSQGCSDVKSHLIFPAFSLFRYFSSFSLLYKTNRFHVAVRLFSNRSQKTSKCGKNISDTLGYASCATFLFLPHFHVICDLLLNRRTATWNLFVNCTDKTNVFEEGMDSLSGFVNLEAQNT